MFEEKTREGENISFPMVFGKYVYVRTISDCHYGIVIEALDYKSSTNTTYACKILLRHHFSDARNMRLLERESRIQHFINHPNIIHNYDTLYFKDHIVLVLDYCANGDLTSFLKKKKYMLNNLKKMEIIVSLIDALSFLHSKNIVHQDIKLDNVFINENGEAMIGDFGCCQNTNENDKTEMRGTLSYTAPEILKGESPHIDLYKCDIWSLGVTLYALMTNTFPWTASSMDDGNLLCQEILNFDCQSSQLTTFICLPIAKLITACLDQNPENRPLAKDLLDIIEEKPFTSAVKNRRRSKIASVSIMNRFDKMLLQSRRNTLCCSDKNINNIGMFNWNKKMVIPVAPAVLGLNQTKGQRRGSAPTVSMLSRR